jgi:hypothetical protein
VSCNLITDQLAQAIQMEGAMPVCGSSVAKPELPPNGVEISLQMLAEMNGIWRRSRLQTAKMIRQSF